MIFRTLIAASILTVPVAAHAGTIGNHEPGNTSANQRQSQSQLTTVYVQPHQSQRNNQRNNQRTTVSNNVTLAAPAAGGGHGGHGGDPSYPVATAYAPSFATYNNCAGSPISAGLQHALVGLTFGSGGGFDEACRLHQLGYDNVAIAYLCRSKDDIHRAFRDAGEACLPEDRPKLRPVAVQPPADPDLVLLSRENLCESVGRGDEVPAICWRR